MLAAIFTGLAGVVTAVAGAIVLLRKGGQDEAVEWKRKVAEYQLQLVQAERDRDEAVRDLSASRSMNLATLRYVHTLEGTLATKGIPLPRKPRELHDG
jgi:hypothetical protein